MSYLSKWEAEDSPLPPLGLLPLTTLNTVPTRPLPPDPALWSTQRGAEHSLGSREGAGH